MGKKDNQKFKKPQKHYEDKPSNYDEEFGVKLSMWYFE